MLVLHIGRHKCGSSSLQYFMSCNAERLRELGVIYPTVGRRSHAHHAMAINLRANSHDEFDAIVDLHAGRSEHVVVSSEELGLLNPMQIAELRRKSGRHDVVVVIYIRDLVGMIPSTYNERTRKGMNLLDFDLFYRSNKPFDGLKIFARAEAWAQSFGWENVRIRSLDPRNLCGGTLIDDFLGIVGLSTRDFGSGDAPGLHPQNVSHGWKVLEVLRAQFAEVAAHRENLEIRRGRPYIQRRLASCLRASVQDVMAELKLDSQRAQYVSARQWKECHEAYGRLVEQLNEVQVGHTIPVAENQMIRERPFLPSLGEISMEERREIAARLQRRKWPRSLADTVVSQPLSAILTNA